MENVIGIFCLTSRRTMAGVVSHSLQWEGAGTFLEATVHPDHCFPPLKTSTTLKERFIDLYGFITYCFVTKSPQSRQIRVFFYINR